MIHSRPQRFFSFWCLFIVLYDVFRDVHGSDLLCIYIECESKFPRRPIDTPLYACSILNNAAVVQQVVDGHWESTEYISIEVYLMMKPNYLVIDRAVNYLQICTNFVIIDSKCMCPEGRLFEACIAHPALDSDFQRL